MALARANMVRVKNILALQISITRLNTANRFNIFRTVNMKIYLYNYLVFMTETALTRTNIPNVKQ